ncbi:hypothetical protein PLICRDRAFT_609536 [Plicaturopsis crispa FD-325 SS-3]|nr:hypothetical protein PLICRDRAFT_609536 [Plicaturopsis crispa FD-325 SS-3]
MVSTPISSYFFCRSSSQIIPTQSSSRICTLVRYPSHRPCLLNARTSRWMRLSNASVLLVFLASAYISKPTSA